MGSAWTVDVVGRVQGVGFRPFVYGLATELGLKGSVRNRTGGVRIELEAERDLLDRFVSALRERAPVLARIEKIEWEVCSARGALGFLILPSESDEGAPVITPDAATCAQCLAEMRDPNDRRYRYAFSNCVDCGPRLSIVTGAPYDRARTTMAAFEMCGACRNEYDEPRDRRFHAQPIACPRCGPRLIMDGERDPIAAAVSAIRAGEIVAIKGIGGYHLACDARSKDAVAELRARKHRPHEPLAVMVPDLDVAREWSDIDEVHAHLLEDRAAPIVLCPLRTSLEAAIAPGQGEIGLMLPYTPLHHLLMEALRIPIVLTSANVHGEPMIHQNDAALAQLADRVLDHDRAIAIRCDDSVVRVVDGDAHPIRVARGYAPLEIELPHALSQPTIALGGHLKATFAIGLENRAIVGPHVGDLDAVSARDDYMRLLDRLCALYRITPTRVVIDRHPDYATRDLATALALPIVEVQHHHAHFAACLAENGVGGEAVGVIYDGAGFGEDGTVWGGEILRGTIARSERVMRWRPVAMPGGERATLEPWRMAAAYLIDAGIDPEPWCKVDRARVRSARAMIAHGICAPLTSSVGRLFDAAAYLCGAVDEVSYEAHAPMVLEAAAHRARGDDAYPIDVHEEIDPRPLWPGLLSDRSKGVSIEIMARRFHFAVIDATARALERFSAPKVALSGGVFANALLHHELSARCASLTHRRLPTNDGGLCLGQLATCAARDGAS